jgi:hypothetical protein
MFRFARRITYLKYREPSGCRASILLVAATESSKSLHIANSAKKIFSTTSSSQNTSLDDSANRPKSGQLELDFFGEPVTFFGLSPDDRTQNAMAALDGFLLCAVSKGKTCAGGGEEAGLEVKSAHSSALSWAECLRHAAVWNHEDEKAAPMLAVVAVAPVLAQAGIGYVKHLDTLLKQAKPGAPGLPTIQMYDIAARAVFHKNDTQRLNVRERIHLLALDYMLQGEYPTALTTYMKLLRSCPGDALALSLAMDLCLTLGDKQSAFRYVPL